MDSMVRLVTVLFAVIPFFAMPCSGHILMLCNTTSPYTIYGHENGTIVSANYPDYVPPRDGSTAYCSLTITVCPSCRIKLDFGDLWNHWMPLCMASTPSSPGSCITGCDHLYLYEPGNLESTFMYVTPSNIPPNATVITKTRQLYLRYCQARETDEQQKKFAISYEVIDKYEAFHGVSPESGVFTSLGFPVTYSSNGDVYVYNLHNDDRQGFIRLSFDDWNLSPFSSIIIYKDGNRIGANYSTSNVLRVTGAHSRPFVMSLGADMTIEFHASTNIDGQYIGFKARFEFVRPTVLSLPDYDGSDTPDVVDEVYYSHVFGGQLYSRCSQYPKNSLIDHLWVIPRSNLVAGSGELMFRITEKVLSGSDYLEIRQGNNSDGELVTVDHTQSENFETSGLYLRLRMRCSWSNGFAAVFAWLQPTDEAHDSIIVCSSESDILCEDKHYCVSSTLHCDGVDHCADGSDERNCSQKARPVSTTTPRGQTNCVRYFYCMRTQQRICATQICDGNADCGDASDEFNCAHGGDYDPFRNYATLGIVVPVAIVSIVVFVIICSVIGFILQRRRRRAAISRARRIMQQRAALRAATEAADSYPDNRGQLMDPSGVVRSPPSYEDTIIFNNMGFVMPDNAANRSLIKPPPYATEDKPEEDIVNGSVQYIPASRVGAVDQPPIYSSVVPPFSAVATGAQTTVEECVSAP